MIFLLPSYRSRTPVPSLGGRSVRCKPVIPLTITGPGGFIKLNVVLDTGADDVIFPADLAIRIGADLSQAPQRYFQGMGSTLPSAVQYGLVILQLTDGQEVCRWRAVVGFTRVKMRFPLFGIAGGLEHFRTTLDVGRREIILDPSPSLPATQDGVP